MLFIIIENIGSLPLSNICILGVHVWFICDSWYSHKPNEGLSQSSRLRYLSPTACQASVGKSNNSVRRNVFIPQDL